MGNELDSEVLYDEDIGVRTLVIKNKLSISRDEVVEANRINNRKNFPKHHSMTDHNFWIRKYKRCIYCDMGSVPMEDSLLKEMQR